MTTTDFRTTVAVNQNPQVVFDAIAHVGGWWSKHFKGNAKNKGDVFSVKFGDTFVDFTITESIPGQKLVWLVTDCNLHWISNKKEWNGTEVVWEIDRSGNSTEIVLTHIGLVPESECYKDCFAGWTGLLKGSLYKLIEEGIGQPE